ncbi:hypothetical protein F2Q69_00011890 [Brassica cretica]|uniref:Uncharacterized protein n=1 Tax=Brassica cretica TaxID=69181 RepID=A0A8S9R2P9_BRACR|nr:hypothetical protein F2Q69_00011890 [Brassica cretica]
MTNDNNTPIDTTDVIQTPLNAAPTDATVTNVGNNTASTAAATTSIILPAGNAANETTRRSLFGAGLYQTGSVSATASGPVAVQTPPAYRSVALTERILRVKERDSSRLHAFNFLAVSNRLYIFLNIVYIILFLLIRFSGFYNLNSYFAFYLKCLIGLKNDL